MRIKSIFIIFLLNYHFGSGQDNFIRKNDSLQNLLNQNIGDSLRIKVLEDLHFTWKNINFEKSIEYSKQAIALARQSKYGYLGLLYQLGFAYMQAGDAVRSIEIFQEIVKEVEDKDPMGYSTVLGFIAMNYENQKNYKTALQYQLKASAIYEPSVADSASIDSRAHLGNPHKLGQYYLKLNQLDSALYYGHIALERLKVVPLSEWNVFFSWYIKTLMGDIQYELKNYKEALHYYGESEKEINENIHALYSYIGDLIPVYLGKSKVFFNLNNRKEAITQARKSFELADTLNALPGKVESADWLKTLYQYEGKLDSALLYYTLSIVTRDSISNTDITRKIDAMEYAEEKRKQEIKALQTEKDYKNKLLYLSTGVLVALLFSGFLYQQNRLKQKSNRILVLEHKEILLQQEKLKREVERFEMQALRAQLNPHFIFNCLNSIDAFIYSNDKYKATTYLNKFAKLLRNILDGSYSNTVNVNLDIQSLKLYVELEELRNNHNFITLYDIDPYFDHSNLEVPPLLVQPIIENAIIHGLKNRNTDNGVLKISIKKLHDQIEYMIEDNGIGREAASLLKEPTAEKTSSYGIALVQSRVKLFNRESNPSIKSEDILNNKIVAGTKVTVYLKFQPI